MRAGAAALQHTLTPEAAVVLKNAVADARRRGHPQVQPLHVAAMLLAFPGSPLRQACMQSHPYTASHPLHCRALELCFNVALERLPALLPTTSGMQSPGLSNALVAALRRAQAQQRRGCPEQQQQPLLAVKVEMEHLVISILDDPSVSRVMREAGFNSTHVKCNMEEAAVCNTPQASASSHVADPSSIGFTCAGSQPYGGSNMHLSRFRSKISLSPMAGVGGSGESSRRVELSLSQDTADGSRKTSKPGKISAGLPSGLFSEEEVRHVIQILLKQKRRNPILVGDTVPTLNLVVQELAQRIETGNVPTQLQGVQFLSPKFTSLASGMYSREDMDRRLGELRKLVDKCMPAGAILYLGDLQWLVEPMVEGFMAFCPMEHAALELGRLLLLYGSHRVWVIGTASCRTYMRFQSRHSLLESEWELQPISFGAGIVLPSETRSNIARSGSLQTLPWHHASQQEKASLWPSVEEEINSWSCCSECLLNCEREHVLLQEQEKAKQQLESTQSCSSSLHGDANETCHSLVQAVSSQQEKHVHAMHFKCSQDSKDAELIPELQKKWQETCHKLHCHKRPPQVSWDAPPEPSSSSSPASADVRRQHRRFQTPQSCICQPAAVHGTKALDIVKGSSLATGWRSPRLVTNSWFKSPSWLSNTLQGGHGGQISKWPGMQCSNNAGEDILSLECSSQQITCGSLSSQEDGVSNKTIRRKGVETELALRTPYAEALPQLTLGGETHVPCRIGSTQPSTQCEQVQDFDSCSSSVQNPGQHNVPCLLPQEAKSNDVEQKVPFNPVKSFQMPRAGVVQPPHRRGEPPGVSKQSDAEASSLCKGLVSRVPWQAEPIKVIANTVSQCRSCMGRRCGPSIRNDTWLLLLGPDKVGKREVARGLAELVFGDEKKLVVLGCHPSKWGSNSEGPDESGILHRGKTSLDRLVDAVRQRPFSVLLLEDVERADSLMRNSLVRAMERGKLADSHGRDTSVGNVIVVMTANLGSEFVIANDLGRISHFDEDKIGRGTGMKLCVGETECCDPVLKDDEGVTLIGQNRSGHVSGSLMCKAKLSPTLCKRKGFDSQTAAWSTYKRSKTHDARRLTAFDLNLSAEENDIEVSTTTSWSKDGPHRLEQQVIDKVLGCARRVLSTNFCAGVDETVIFAPFGLHNFFGSVLEKLECISYRVADLGASFEVEVGVLEQMLAASWQMPGGDEACSSWIVQVLIKSLETLVSTHGDVSGKAVKLIRGDCSPYVDARLLPSAIEVIHDL